MNRVFSKCSDFGLMIKLNGLDISESLICVKVLREAKVPLCIIDGTEKHWEQKLHTIATEVDLFIAVDNITSIEMAYKAVGSGAQFLLLPNCDRELMKQLLNSGLYFIPTINSAEDEEYCIEIGVECSIYHTKMEKRLPFITEYSDTITPLHKNSLFGIVSIESCFDDYRYWINSIRTEQLGSRVTTVMITDSINNEDEEFVSIYSTLHRCNVVKGDKKKIIFEVVDLIRTINDYKWSSVYFNPNNAIIEDDRIKEVELDTTVSGFSIILKEITT